MVIDVTRIIKEGKLVALFWNENDCLIIKDNVRKEPQVCIKSDVDNIKFMFIKQYCEDNHCSKLHPILLDKNDINDFFESVNNSSVKPQMLRLKR